MLIRMTVNKTRTHKYYFLFRTHGTEHMPKNTIFFALRVSTVLCCCYVLLFLLFYANGGGGEVACCRVFCYVSNEDARLVFIVEWTSALASIQLLNMCGLINDKACSYDNGFYCPLCPISLTTGSLSTMEGCHS